MSTIEDTQSWIPFRRMHGGIPRRTQSRRGRPSASPERASTTDSIFSSRSLNWLPGREIQFDLVGLLLAMAAALLHEASSACLP
jgi:hypothetical protein